MQKSYRFDAEKGIGLMELMEENGVYKIGEDKCFYAADPIGLWDAAVVFFLRNVSTRKIIKEIVSRAENEIKKIAIKSYLKTKKYLSQLKTKLYRFTPNR